MPDSTILHLSADFPDGIRDRTTYAVRNLLEEAKGFDHVVISLKRQADPRKTYFVEDAPYKNMRIFAYGYWGLPMGILHLTSMRLASLTIARELKRRHIAPHAIHAHKIGFEGFIAYFLSRRFRIPYLLSVRGEVETKILRYKPLLRPFFRKIVEGARHIYLVSMWFKPQLLALAPSVEPKMRALPNFVAQPPQTQDTAPPPHPAFVTIADLNDYRKKGFHWLVPAFARFAKNRPEARLDVIGWASEETMTIVRQLVEDAGVADKVSFLGVMKNTEIIEGLPRYTALVVPSVNETFGMVYVEALLCRLPVLYTRGTGIDGYLDDLKVGIGVKEGSIDEIASGLERLENDKQAFRQEIETNASSIGDRFSTKRHAQNYVDDLMALTGSPS